ncbi:hypothetical protein N7517_002048 [Penicillium concentricum]|uniref:Uncharacterized protein n=1 Tax=Penicillium concentricum TaxID=293559 RepID=A0A9W9ST28_9EURO|nr:uncharacterized protein N7517_002048 [Penicillium concentricum]KAJ5384137.1 hypothetical protein N7517_002048 [Penicillium concentricum]
MLFTNFLPNDADEGTIDDIAIHWGPNGLTRLVQNAEAFNLPQVDLKHATEHVAHACAKRLDLRLGLELSDMAVLGESVVLSGHRNNRVHRRPLVSLLVSLLVTTTRGLESVLESCEVEERW